MSDKTEAEPKAEEKKIEFKDQLVQTQHSVVLDGQTIEYTVTAGTIVLKEEAEKTGDKAGESEG